MHISRWISGLMLLALLLGFAGVPAHADALAQAGRDIATKWRQAIVPLQVTVKTHFAGGGEEATSEDKSETVGTVIDPSGLIVTSLAGMSFASEMGMDDDDEVQVTTEISSILILLEGGQEIAAGIVLRDKELDLAFIRPLKPLAAPLTAIDLKTAGKPGLLDEVIMLDRLGLAGNRSIAAYPMRITSIVEKPRLLYVGMSIGNNLGVPLFTLDGKPIGIRVLQQSPPGTGGKYGADMIDVFRPAHEIVEAAKQAK